MTLARPVHHDLKKMNVMMSSKIWHKTEKAGITM